MASTLTKIEDGFLDNCAENSTLNVSEPQPEPVATMADDPMSILNEIEKKCMEREVENDPKVYDHNSVSSELTDRLKPNNGMSDHHTNGEQLIDTDHTLDHIQTDVGQNSNNSNITQNTGDIAEVLQKDSINENAGDITAELQMDNIQENAGDITAVLQEDKPTDMEVDRDVDDEATEDDERNSDIMAIDVSTNMGAHSDGETDEAEEGETETNNDDPSVQDRMNDNVNTVEGNDSVVSQDGDTVLDESSTLEDSSDPLNTTGDVNGDGELIEDPPIEIQAQGTRGIKRRKKRKKWGKVKSKPAQYKVRRLSGQSLCLSLTTVAGTQSGEIAEETNDAGSQAIEGGMSLLKDHGENVKTENVSPLQGKQDTEAKFKFTPEKKGRSLLIDHGEKVETKNVPQLPQEQFERYQEAFKQGFQREVVWRGSIIDEFGRECKSRLCDVYYHPAQGKKLRSMVQIQEWLSMHDSNLTTQNFSFMRRPIGVEGEVVRHASASRGRVSLDNVKKEVKKEVTPGSLKKIRKPGRPRIKQEHIYHDDNNPLYDKPEVVIERDTDDMYAPIIAAGLRGDFPPVRFDTSSLQKNGGKSPQKVYVGLNGETLETMHPSNETVIVTPTKRLKFKATARKSTMQKPIKQPRPYEGEENLCSVKCPGLEGMAPMLMCNKCMCLFHHECVNYYDNDDEFCCLRCKGADPLPDPSLDQKHVMRVSLPEQMNQLDQTISTSINSIPTVVHCSPHPVGAVIPSTALLTRPTNSQIYQSLNQPKSKYQEIRPLLKVKEEPYDDSYEKSQASSEALGSLKSVLNRRTSSSPANSGQTMLVPGQSLLGSQHKYRPINQHPNPKFINKINPPLHLPQNSNYKLVPIGPPVSLPNIPFQPIRLPGMSVQGLVPMAPIHTNSKGAHIDMQKNMLVSQPPLTTSNSLLVPQDSYNKSKTKTSPSKGDGKGARLVIDGTTIGAPESGQLLTLPGAVSKKLTLNKPLVLKIKNRQISVPPSGFFQAADGLKIFLPPNTFPTAEEEEAAAAAESAKNNNSVPSTSAIKSLEKSAASDVAPCPEVKSVKSGDTSADVVKSRRGQKCCFIQKLYGGYDCMFQIFHFLSIKELLAVSRVCRTWRFISQHPSLWNHVLFSGLKVSNWPKAMEFLGKRGITSISLLGMDVYEDLERTWNGFITSVADVSTVQKLSFGLVPPLILDAVCLKLTNLQSVCAECVSNEEEETIWTNPTRLDIGKFGGLQELRELRLKGVCGLTLPTFSLCGGLSNLGTLEKLNKLCLTSLKNVDGSKFHFISKLKNLTELSLGDCKTWTAETYAVLGEMTSLRKLRLEQGGEIQDTGLGNAISKLNNLHTLELYLFVIADTFREHVMGLSKLRTLLIWPDNSTQPAEVNSNTFSAVKDLSSLHRLKWVILKKQSNSIILDDNENTETVIKEQEWIPFLSEDSSVDNKKTEYIGLGKLTHNLSELLPKTRIEVFCLESDKDTQPQL